MSEQYQVSVSLSFREVLNRYQIEQEKRVRESGASYITSSGLMIDMLGFSAKDVRLEDIAAGLSKTCRFSGQCRRFYSVAEHSILVSKYIGYFLKNAIPGVTVAAFLHDSPEAYLGDMTTPLKKLCPGYQLIEDRFERAIQEAFGVTIGFDHPAIKECDQRMYLRERALLMPVKDEIEPSELDDLLRIRCLNPEEAKRAFLERAEELQVKLAA